MKEFKTSKAHKTSKVFKTIWVWNHDNIPNEVSHFRRNFFLSVLFLLISAPLFAQFSISGKVLYKADNSPIKNAEVYNLDLGKSTITDADGNFQFNNTPAGTYEFAVFDMEYKVLKESVTISQNTVINFKLEPLGEQLSEVEIGRASCRERV